MKTFSKILHPILNMLNPYHKKLLIAVFILQTTTGALAQQDSTSEIFKTEKNQFKPAGKTIFSYNAGIHYGFILVHSQEVRYGKGSHPAGVELNIGWQKNDTASVNICNCYPKKGVLVSYFDYDNHILGKVLGAAFFLEPSYRLGKNVFFSFRGSIGGAYLTKPYDSIKNPGNRSYSTAFNFYLTLGTGLWFRLSKHWWLNSSLMFQHISNAGMKLPNAGINWPTAGLTIGYQKNPMIYYNGTRKKEKNWNKNLRWDFSAFGIEDKVVEQKKKKLYPIYGGGIQISKQVGILNALTFGVEAFADPGHSVELKQQDSIIANAGRVGILAGHEFLLGKFIFSQRIGAYIYNQTTYPRIFHRWALVYRIDPHWSAGFSFLAHGRFAEFFDLKLTYSLQKLMKNP